MEFCVQMNDEVQRFRDNLPFVSPSVSGHKTLFRAEEKTSQRLDKGHAEEPGICAVDSVGADLL